MRVGWRVDGWNWVTVADGRAGSFPVFSNPTRGSSSSTWETRIVTFLLVALLPNTQHRSEAALHHARHRRRPRRPGRVARSQPTASTPRGMRLWVVPSTPGGLPRRLQPGWAREHQVAQELQDHWRRTSRSTHNSSAASRASDSALLPFAATESHMEGSSSAGERLAAPVRREGRSQPRTRSLTMYLC